MLAAAVSIFAGRSIVGRDLQLRELAAGESIVAEVDLWLMGDLLLLGWIYGCWGIYCFEDILLLAAGDLFYSF